MDTVERALLVAKNAVSSESNNERNGHLSEDERSEPNEAAANAGPSEASNKRCRLSDAAANPRPSKTHRLATPEPEAPVHVSSQADVCSNVTEKSSPMDGGLSEDTASSQPTEEPSDSSSLSEADEADGADTEGHEGTETAPIVKGGRGKGRRRGRGRGRGRGHARG